MSSESPPCGEIVYALPLLLLLLFLLLGPYLVFVSSMPVISVSNFRTNVLETTKVARRCSISHHPGLFMLFF